ncbi:adenylate kinase domain-containing protein [Phthorimaea operculella]|nr:adenylate kinase domain-containing protein [Phthorimaea operculella]
MPNSQIVDEKICEGPCQSNVIDKNPPCPLQCGVKGCKAFKDGPKIDLRDHIFIWLYGGPSSGKSTQCQQLCAKYGLTRVHVGELVKKEIASGSVRHKCLQNAMNRGELVPNDVALELLKKEIYAKAKTTKGFVIDGFPREKRQGVLFEQEIAPVTIIIFLDAKRETMTDRHVGRAEVSQKRWPTEKRDDKCVAGKYQLHVFFQNHKSIFDQYPHKIFRVNAENRSVKDIFEDIVKVVDKEVNRLKYKTALRKADEAKWKALEPKEKPSVPL